MTAERSIRYDFGKCSVEYVNRGDSPYYETPPITLRVRQADFGQEDEAQFTLLRHEAVALADRLLELLYDTPRDIAQMTAVADTRC